MEFPPLCHYAQWLVEAFQESGKASAGEVLSYAAISSWADIWGLSLTPWEAETIRILSGSYMSAYRASDEDKNTPPPNMTVEGEKQRAQQASQAALRSWLV